MSSWLQVWYPAHEYIEQFYHRQSGQAFKDKLGAFRKAVSKVAPANSFTLLSEVAELEFVTAPHLIPSKDGEEVWRRTRSEGEQEEEQELLVQEQQYGWWFSRPDDSFDAHEYVDCVKGFDQRLLYCLLLADSSPPAWPM